MRAPKAPHTWTPVGPAAGLVHFNPCGQIVANLRDGYETDCRFFRDSDTVVRIRWVRAQPGAKVMDNPSPISSLRWKPFPWTQVGVGEVFNADVLVRQFPPIPGADGQSFCGNVEDFERGAVFDPDAPPMQYSPEGLALCCAADPGGFEAGGEAEVPAPPSFCTFYDSDSVLYLTTTRWERNDVGPQVSWRSTTDGDGCRLWAPNQYAPGTDWTITTALGSRWEANVPWDGVGCRTFLKLAGPGPFSPQICCDD